ncbi:MAG TPA: hypothetical protein P5519_02055 [Spirochaetia bacterium]|nr:hypothetical protein [Spirochaetales bacterium]HRS64658.1 hypothetical protein [Spirochaetia bacterium]HOT58078.1 hypothetical protein [Spirochaetales bacterium]HPD79640.1 hypothetical protein [Spirochaetales bacterium]HQK33794.1 hypothetical protein [Spirochaetales bacterium]
MKQLLIMLACFLSLFMSGCSSSVETAISATGAISIFIKTDVYPSLESKIRPFSTAKDGPVINAADVFHISLPKGLTLLSSKNPSLLSYEGTFRIDNLEEFLAMNPEIKESGAIISTKTASWEELTLTFSRKTARLFVNIFPFLNNDLLDALAPPALYEGESTPEEYKKMLSSLFGKKAMQDIETAVLRLNIKTPAPILELEGCSKTGNALATLTVPLLTCIILEQPITIRLRWQR